MDLNLDDFKGIMFLNKFKTPGDSRPDWTGEIKLGMQEFKVSAWKNMSKFGNPYMSMSLTPKDAPLDEGHSAPDDDEEQEDIPW